MPLAWAAHVFHTWILARLQLTRPSWGSASGYAGGRDAVADASPTIRQRELGMRLREYRTNLGLTVEEVAQKLLCSATKVSRAETGARRPGWWTQYDDLKVHFPFIGLEQDATAITCFAMYFVPAFLQTANYARAIIKGIVPKIDPDVLDQRVAARMRRQELLYKTNAPIYRVLLDEAVLHRQVGGLTVMRAQLAKMTDLVNEKRATIQIIPFAAGAYAAADSNFDYLEFGGSALPDLVYVEGLARDLYLDRRHDVERYSETIEYMRDTALSPGDSVKKIQNISDRYAAQ